MTKSAGMASAMPCLELPYILAYKSQNLRPNLDQKVGRATYTQVIKKKFLQLVEPVSLKHARTPTRRESSIKARRCTEWTLVTATATGTLDGCQDAALRSLLRSVE